MHQILSLSPDHFQGGRSNLLALEKPAIDWTDELIERIPTTSVFMRFFKKRIRERLYAVRDYYIQNPQVRQNEWNTKKFLQEQHREVGVVESIFTNEFYRTLTIRYGFTLTILAMHFVS